MKIAVIGGTGLIGSQVVEILTAQGHDAVPHSPSTGLDLLTGTGLPEALASADVVVNLTNSPTFDDASPAFFRTSMDNLMAAARAAGVGHAVILSIVGVDQVPGLVYYQAKALQEELLKNGGVPYSIVRATQFFEFMDAAMSWTADADTVRLPATPIQPMAAADVARAVAEVAAGAPLEGIRNVAGPDVFTLDELGRITLAARGDKRSVTTDPTAGMFAAVPGDVLVAPQDAVIAQTHYRDWLAK
ncbi:SDR family oxidoreductase [Catenulispora subtropica]|uniref:NAD(P)H-binding protein n=1 Tax=Catenulispora subtropica TaxID=450798 RepID=A0ABN2S0K2_9ACTN